MIFAFYTDRLRLSSLYFIINDECSQFSALDAAGIETFGIIVYLETLARIMAVDDCGSQLGGNEVLILVPQLSVADNVSRSSFRR